jgi:hypothetical protein
MAGCHDLFGGRLRAFWSVANNGLFALICQLPDRQRVWIRFCLDGQRLVLVPNTGDYGDEGSEYRTEIESFRKIVAHGQAGSGTAYFIVKDRDG